LRLESYKVEATTSLTQGGARAAWHTPHGSDPGAPATLRGDPPPLAPRHCLSALVDMTTSPRSDWLRSEHYPNPRRSGMRGWCSAYRQTAHGTTPVHARQNGYGLL